MKMQMFGMYQASHAVCIWPDNICCQIAYVSGISQNIQTLHTHIPRTGTSFLTGVHNLLCTQYLQVSDEI